MTDKLLDGLLNQTHILIAGATGTGKSVLINDLIYTGLQYPKNIFSMILIDPKMVELSKYRFLPHCIGYASQPADIAGMIKKAVGIMMRRYKAMTWQGLTAWPAGQIYIFIDEYADLSITCKRAIPDILRLCQLGRAAGIHVIIATQRPTRDIITGAIKVNLDTRIALHVPTAQDSRNIIGIKAAENLPLYGYGYLYTPAGIEKIGIPYIQPADIADRITSIYRHQSLPGKALRFIKHIKVAI